MERGTAKIASLSLISVTSQDVCLSLVSLSPRGAGYTLLLRRPIVAARGGRYLVDDAECLEPCGVLRHRVGLARGDGRRRDRMEPPVAPLELLDSRGEVRHLVRVRATVRVRARARARARARVRVGAFGFVRGSALRSGRRRRGVR